MKFQPPQSNMYSNLSRFYKDSNAKTGSFLHGYYHRLLPTAPLLSEEDLVSFDSNTTGGELHPDEPDADYWELEPDYDDGKLDDDKGMMMMHNNLNRDVGRNKTVPDKKVPVVGAAKEGREHSADLRQWLKWRTDSNRLLASAILSRQSHGVPPRVPDIRRTPLSPRSVDNLLRDARSAGRDALKDRMSSRTSLPESGYIMYGIPRVASPGHSHS